MMKVYSRDLLLLLVILTLGWVSLAFFFHVVLDFNFMGSDVQSYWQDSMEWQTPFNSVHVPGYPLIIALSRGLGPGIQSPIILMMGINFMAFVVSAVAVFFIIISSGVPKGFATLGAALFGLWPFVGLVYAVYPIADTPAIAFLLTGILALLHLRRFLAALLLGISLVVHKAMWPIVVLLVVAYLVSSRQRSWRDYLALLIMILPVVVLWVGGMHYYGSPMWIISTSVGVGADFRATRPVFEGIIGTFQQGGFRGGAKGGIITGFFIASIALAFLNARVRPRFFLYGIAVCVGSFSLFAFMTHVDIWAAVRFSRLLVVPLVWLVSHLYRGEQPIWFGRRMVAVLMLVCFSSQFFFSWYMAKVFIG